MAGSVTERTLHAHGASVPPPSCDEPVTEAHTGTRKLIAGTSRESSPTKRVPGGRSRRAPGIHPEGQADLSVHPAQLGLLVSSCCGTSTTSVPYAPPLK